jgi:catechol 2,3-dioxygenase-like lactoylglutathione lyase family enzyme
MSRHFGPIRQNGYVVRDIEAALDHWTQVLGVGPFFYFERAPIADFRFRGETSELEVSIALANSGDLQIELIEPRNDAPSMYRDFLAAGREGLQHVAFWTEDFDAGLEAAISRGYRVAQSGQSGGPDGRFVYFEEEAHPGTVIELSEVSGAKGRFFAHIRAQEVSWDGTDPVRVLGTPAARPR